MQVEKGSDLTADYVGLCIQQPEGRCSRPLAGAFLSFVREC